MASCAPKTLRIVVENPISVDRASELAETDAEKVRSRLKSETFLLKNAKGEEVTYQLTSDGKLVFQAGTGAGETATFHVERAHRLHPNH